MFLNIILTILTIVLVTITFLLNKWWRNYGKEMFQSFKKMKEMMPPKQMMNDSSQPQNLNDLMDRLNKLNQMFGTPKK